MTTTIEALNLLADLDTPALEVVLDQVRIAYRTQEAIRAANRAALAEIAAAQPDSAEPEPADPAGA